MANEDPPDGVRQTGTDFDVFISHASEDKDAVARPLTRALEQRGRRVWLDEQELTIGDTLGRKIDEGLTRSRFGVVILSPNFFSKHWPRRELDGLVARETLDGAKVILPVWHEVTSHEVMSESPTLAARLAADTSRGIEAVADAVERALAAATGDRHAVSQPIVHREAGSAHPKTSDSSQQPADEADVQGSLRSLLRESTIWISISDMGPRGSGFFVAPELVVTCKHVLEPLDLERPEAAELLGIEDVEGSRYQVRQIREVSADDVVDLALLRVEPAEGTPVLLGPGLDRGDQLEAFGYTALHPEGVPVRLEAEGLTGDGKLIKLRGGTVERGMAGAPLLNLRTGAVCGVLKRTRDPLRALGGYAIPLAALIELSPAVIANNRAWHTQRRHGSI